MNEDFGADLITLVDDDGQEHEFELLMEFEYEDALYYALLPTYNNVEDMIDDNSSYYIFEVTNEDGEDLLSEVRDDDLLDKLAEVFEELYYSDEEDDD